MLLGGFDYCMQYLCMPIRYKIDSSHIRGQYLDSFDSTTIHICFACVRLSRAANDGRYSSLFYSALYWRAISSAFATPHFFKVAMQPKTRAISQKLRSTTL